MSKLLILLSPPRSYSSVVATQIGQHPDLYGFPELRLFVGDTVAEILNFSQQRAQDQLPGPPGLLRSLAQLHERVQTTSTIINALAWLEERKDWYTRDLFNYLLEKISPKIGVEKTPQTCMKTQYLDRAYESFPQAYYLHLTRHPVSTRTSILANNQAKKISLKRKSKKSKKTLDPIYRWYRIHNNIISITSRLPPRQTLRIKGEDLLSEPDKFLPIIAKWLGVRTDQEAIEAMKHPENSPYACLGPELAQGGNNLEFLQNPYLRKSKVQEPSLTEFWEQQKQEFRDEFGYELESEQDISEKVTKLARIMGYQ